MNWFLLTFLSFSAVGHINFIYKLLVSSLPLDLQGQTDEFKLVAGTMAKKNRTDLVLGTIMVVFWWWVIYMANVFSLL
jgi:hypothetical protein